MSYRKLCRCSHAQHEHYGAEAECLRVSCLCLRFGGPYVGARIFAAEGITNSYSYERTEREIGGTVYIFVRYYSVWDKSHRGIKVLIKPDHPLEWGEKPTVRAQYGEPMPERHGF